MGQGLLVVGRRAEIGAYWSNSKIGCITALSSQRSLFAGNPRF
jgi:hypothetical protein